MNANEVMPDFTQLEDDLTKEEIDGAKGSADLLNADALTDLDEALLGGGDTLPFDIHEGSGLLQ